MPRLVSHPDEVKIVTRRLAWAPQQIDRIYRARRVWMLQEVPRAGSRLIIAEMKGLQPPRRGGAGFPTGLKWSLRSKQNPNLNTSRKRRRERARTARISLIFLHDPHASLKEPSMPASPIGPRSLHLSGAAISLPPRNNGEGRCRRLREGLLGKNIFGSETEFEIITQSGAGAYEVGEESALMESLEGKRGNPAHQAPFLLSSASTADPPSSTMLRPSPPCPTSSRWCGSLCGCRLGPQRRNAPLRPQRPRRTPRRLRAAHGLQPQEMIYEVAAASAAGAP